MRLLALGAACLLLAACSDDSTEGEPFQPTGSDQASGAGAGSGSGGSGGLDIGIGGTSVGSGGQGPSVPMFSELWYAVDQLLVLITIDAADGSVAGIQSSAITEILDEGQTATTMLD